MSPRELRVGVLYPDLLDAFGDRGNLLVLRRRCEWRGLGFRLRTAGLGEPLRGPVDLLYLGGGVDSDQRRCAEDLAEQQGAAVRDAVEAGAVLLGVGSGFELLGRSCQIGDECTTGLGLVDTTTVRGGPPLEGNTVAEVDLPDGRRLLAGYQNHAGRTTLGPGAAPLGRVVAGPGNDDEGGLEGVRQDRVVGTYLRGPVLALNTWFADLLLREALGGTELAPLDDTLEDGVHRLACRRADGAVTPSTASQA